MVLQLRTSGDGLDFCDGRVLFLQFLGWMESDVVRVAEDAANVEFCSI